MASAPWGRIRACLAVTVVLSEIHVALSLSGHLTSKIRPDARLFASASPFNSDSDDALSSLFSTLDMQESDYDIMNDLKSADSKDHVKRKNFHVLLDVERAVREADPSSPEKADRAVRRLLNAGETRPSALVHAHNLRIRALSKSKRRDAGVRAEAILDEMLRFPLEPNAVTYASVLDAHAKSNAPQEAEDFFFRIMEFKDARCSPVLCDIVINAWAKSGTAAGARRAQDILVRLERLQRPGIRPTEYSYAAVINGWSKVKTADAAMQADLLLQKMIEKALQAKKKDAFVKPDTFIFNTVIAAWSTSKDPQAGVKATALLKQMKDLVEKEKWDVKPDTVTYNSVLSAWGRCGHMNAALQTESLVKEMHLSEDPDIAPNTISYNTVLDAWSRSSLTGAAERAQKILNFMIRASKQKPEIAPDAISFNSACDVWAKSKEPNKAMRVRQNIDLLAKMYEATGKNELAVSKFHYNTLLNACAFSAQGTSEEEQKQALKLATQTFSEMRKARGRATPDAITYGIMLKCLVNLMPPGKTRQDMAMRVFGFCCQDGLVNQMVWDQIRKAVPSNVIAETTSLKRGIGNLYVDDLPLDWRRNSRFDRKAPASRKKRVDKKPPKKVAKPSFGSFVVEGSFQSGKDL